MAPLPVGAWMGSGPLRRVRSALGRAHLPDREEAMRRTRTPRARFYRVSPERWALVWRDHAGDPRSLDAVLPPAPTTTEILGAVQRLCRAAGIAPESVTIPGDKK